MTLIKPHEWTVGKLESGSDAAAMYQWMTQHSDIPFRVAEVPVVGGGDEQPPCFVIIADFKGSADRTSDAAVARLCYDRALIQLLAERLRLLDPGDSLANIAWIWSERQPHFEKTKAEAVA